MSVVMIEVRNATCQACGCHGPHRVIEYPNADPDLYKCHTCGGVWWQEW